MRLFIAIDLGNEQYFRDIQKRFDIKNAKLNLTKSYHLTLKFLGEVRDEAVHDLKDKLSQLKFDIFRIKTTKIGVFPDENRINVIWAGLDPEDLLINLQKKIDTLLEGFFAKEKRFKAHLTLARVKFVNDNSKFAESLRKIKIESKEFKVNNIKLIKSTLLPDGPVYETILEIKNSKS